MLDVPIDELHNTHLLLFYLSLSGCFLPLPLSLSLKQTNEHSSFPLCSLLNYRPFFFFFHSIRSILAGSSASFFTIISHTSGSSFIPLFPSACTRVTMHACCISPSKYMSFFLFPSKCCFLGESKHPPFTYTLIIICTFVTLFIASLLFAL